MNCTTYDDAIAYDAPISYDGVCVQPVPVITPSRGAGYTYRYRKPDEEDEIIVAILLELLEE